MVDISFWSTGFYIVIIQALFKVFYGMLYFQGLSSALEIDLSIQVLFKEFKYCTKPVIKTMSE